MALYPLNVGDLPQISDVNQLTDMFNGKHDTGAVTFAPQLSAPPISGVSATAQAGTLLGVGPYNYQITAITGYYKTNGTLQKTGETPVSSAVAVTTTSGNQAVKITLPTTGLPISQVAWGIYRTAVSGSTYGLVASVKVGNASYTDTTADGSRGAVPPTVNTTGMNFTFNGYLNLPNNTYSNNIIPSSFSTYTPNVTYVIPFNGTSWNNGVFTAPVKGTFIFIPAIYLNLNNAQVSIDVYSNGLYVFTCGKVSNPNATTWDYVVHAPIIWQLNPGDTVQFKLTVTGTFSGNINYGHTYCATWKLG